MKKKKSSGSLQAGYVLCHSHHSHAPALLHALPFRAAPPSLPPSWTLLTLPSCPKSATTPDSREVQSAAFKQTPVRKEHVNSQYGKKLTPITKEENTKVKPQRSILSHLSDGQKI